MTKKILLYNIEEDKIQTLGSLRDELDFEIVSADDSDLNKNVAYLVGSGPDIEYDNLKTHPVDINFMMFHGFDDKELNDLLKGLKENNINTPNKCVSTETNLSWSLFDLLVENKEESELMPIITNIQRIFKAGLGISEENPHDIELKNQLNKINSYMTQPEFEKDELIKLYNDTVKLVNPYLT